MYRGRRCARSPPSAGQLDGELCHVQRGAVRVLELWRVSAAGHLSHANTLLQVLLELVGVGDGQDGVLRPPDDERRLCHIADERLIDLTSVTAGGEVRAECLGPLRLGAMKVVDAQLLRRHAGGDKGESLLHSERNGCHRRDHIGRWRLVRLTAGVEEHESGDSLRVGLREVERHSAAEGGAHNDDRLAVELIAPEGLPSVCE